MKHYFYFTILLLLTACKENISTKELMQQEMSIEEMMQLILSEDYTSSKMDQEGRNLLYSYYEKRNFKPLWSTKQELNEIGTELKQAFETSIQFGLSEKRLLTNWSDELALHNEVNIVCNLARSYMDLKHGMLDSTMKKQKHFHYPQLESLDTLVQFSTGKVAQKIIAWGPSDSLYQVMANALFRFVQENNVHQTPIEVVSIEKDAAKAIESAKLALIEKGYLDSLKQNDSVSYQKALKKFQAENGCAPDGVVGKATARILSESNLHKAQRIALMMEKQRHKETYPKRYFYINIPEYMLRLYNEDTLCSENKIVVGKFENQTPELSSKLHSIVVYPYWNVPYSIASKEILPAAKNNPNYFAKNEMVVLSKNDTINPMKVNWKKYKENTFPYKVVQQPGYKNSLGIIKFEFHNKYDVYFHDTPSKNYFNTVARTYSHGCMRTQNPVELAKIVLELEEHKVTADSLDTLIAHTGINVPIRLKKPIPIFVEYNTVLFPENSIQFLRDVYLRDEEYLHVLFAHE